MKFTPSDAAKLREADIVLRVYRLDGLADLLAQCLIDSTPDDRVFLLGVPLDRITALTLDGAHWIEVFGRIAYASAGGGTLTFRIAQAPGGKQRKLGIGQGDIVSIAKGAVRGVTRKADQTL